MHVFEWNKYSQIVSFFPIQVFEWNKYSRIVSLFPAHVFEGIFPDCQLVSGAFL
jgi:hypothetical protein